MLPNHEFMVEWAARHRPGPGARILDYGCGSGEVVQGGLAAGLDILGTDVFYEGGTSRKILAGTNLLGDRVLEMSETRIPLPDGSVDMVLSNQVFEHVEDLDATLAEIARVLVPGGRLLSLFPSRDVIREGHSGIPAVHWLASDGALRYRYALTARRLGLGHNKGAKSPEAWTRDMLDWLDRYTIYRSRDAIMRSYARWFRTEPVEEEYIAFRLRRREARRAAGAVATRVMRPPARLVCRKLAGLVLWSEKAGA